MFNINDLLINESDFTMVDENYTDEAFLESAKNFDWSITESDISAVYEEYLCEWKVDKEKKSKIIKDCLKALEREISGSTKVLKKGVSIYGENTVIKVNKTFWEEVLNHKNVESDKQKKILIGHYNFTLKECKDMIEKGKSPYADLKKCMAAAEERTPDGVSYEFGTTRENEFIDDILKLIPIPGLNHVVRVIAQQALKHKAGTIWIVLSNKKLYKQSKNESAIEFVNSIMESLFSEDE